MNNIPPCHSPSDLRRNQPGFTYVELMVTLAIGSLLIAGLGGVVGQALQSMDVVSETNKLTRDARFAMQRMTSSAARSTRLILPFADDPRTNWPEHIREETIPASAPNGDSIKSTAVLALSLPHDSDLNQDGFPDADNDLDGKIDEDPGGDSSNDLAPGLIGIDDDGDGKVDEQHTLTAPDGKFGPTNEDDDEDDTANEDLVDGVDDDGDGKLDEDIKKQTDGDDIPGIAGVDDDGDGFIDEGDKNDEDEDGNVNEDWYDNIVYYLNGNTLIERINVPWDANADVVINGADFIESVIAENITRFSVERVDNGSGVDVIELILDLTSPLTGESINLQTQIRIGAAL